MDNENFNVEFGEVVNIGGGTSDFNQLSNRPNYDNTTMTGATNIPKVPTKTSDLTNDGSDGTSTYVESDDLATVATSGSYNDLSNTPTIPESQVQSDWSQTDNTKVDFIKNKPTIPSAQVNADWNASSGVAEILNKPTIPTVNDATLTITQNGTTKGTFTANDADDTTIEVSDTTYSDFTGTDGTAAGVAGLVPAPATTDAGKFLKADGTWDTAGGGGTTYTAGDGIDITDDTISVDTDTIQEKLTAGTGIDITNNTISATGGGGGGDTVYSDKSTSNSATGGAVYIGNLDTNQDEQPDPTTTDNHYRYFWALPFDNNQIPQQRSINIFGQNEGMNSISLGVNAIARLDSQVAIGAQTLNNYSATEGVALGYSARSQAASSVALGARATATRAGEVNVGNTSGEGYNNTNYRVIGGVHDPVDNHDAATKGYVDPTTDSSAPTTATVGRLGQIQIDTTTATAYMCVEADDVTPTYSWKKITT